MVTNPAWSNSLGWPRNGLRLQKLGPTIRVPPRLKIDECYHKMSVCRISRIMGTPDTHHHDVDESEAACV
jgi:hypothetical protein